MCVRERRARGTAVDYWPVLLCTGPDDPRRELQIASSIAVHSVACWSCHLVSEIDNMRLADRQYAASIARGFM